MSPNSPVHPACPQCGAPIPSGAPEGHCPGCLLDLIGQSGLPTELDVETPGLASLGEDSAAGFRSLTDHEVEEEIARGGMGVILRVRDPVLDRTLAMKVMQPRYLPPGSNPSSSRRAVMRFIEEAHVTARLDHPGIVPVHELGLDSQGMPCFTMKLVNGQDLNFIFQLLHAGKEGWNLPRAIGVLVKACQALAYAHEKGVIHRDLKPANIMVGRYGEVYVMDWGLAKVLEKKEPSNSSPAGAAIDPKSQTESTLQSLGEQRLREVDATQDGSVMGTPSYMSPEQASGWIDQLDHRADIYSLGAILHHLLTGLPPFVEPGSGSTASTLLARVREGPPQRVHRINPQAPPELIAICEKAMAREKQARYDSSLSLAEDLQAFLDNRVVQAYRTGPLAELVSWFLRNQGLAIAAGTALLVAAAGLFAFAWQREQAAARLRLSLYAADMRLAYDALAAGNRGQAVSLLRKYVPKPGSPNLNGFEWRQLWQESRGRELFTLTGARGRVVALAFSPDGQTLYSGGFDSQIDVWDLESRRMKSSIPFDGGLVGFLAATPDGTALIVGAPRKVVVRAGKNFTTENQIQGAMSPAALSPDGKLLVAATTNGLAVWSTDGWKRVWDLPLGDSAAAEGLVFSPDGTRIAAGYFSRNDIQIQVWDISRSLSAPPLLLTSIQPGSGPSIFPILSLGFSLDGSLLAVGSATQAGNLLQIWEARDGRLHSQAQSPALLTGIRFMTGDRAILTSSFAQQLELWNFSGKTNLAHAQSIPGHHNEVWALEMSPQGTVFATGCKDSTIKMWRTEEVLRPDPGQEQIPVSGHASIGFSPDEKWMAMAVPGAPLEIRDFQTLKLNGTHTFPPGTRLMSVAPNASWLLASREDGSRVVGSLDPSSGPGTIWLEILPPNTPERDTPSNWSRDGNHLVIVQGNEGALWDLQKRRRVVQFTLAESPDRQALSHDARWLACHSKTSGQTRIWDLAKKREILNWKNSRESFNHLEFSPDGHLLAIANMDNTVNLWKIPEGSQIASLTGHTLAVWRLTFSSDGKTLLTRGSDAIRLWHVPTHQELMVIPEGGIENVWLSPRDSLLAIQNSPALLLKRIPSMEQILQSQPDGQ